MRFDAVADVGNTRVKWARCGRHGISTLGAFAPDDADAWTKLASDLPRRWAIGSVVPALARRLVEWLTGRGCEVRVLASRAEISIAVDVDVPERVGLDRLFNAVAAVARAGNERATIVVDAGSAVTVDLVVDGVFRGGAIFPGLRLMAHALHAKTAQLPAVAIADWQEAPGRHTEAAIAAGIAHAVAGGIDKLVTSYRQRWPLPNVFLTGGDAEFLSRHLAWEHRVDVALTLDGIRLSAESLA